MLPSIENKHGTVFRCGDNFTGVKQNKERLNTRLAKEYWYINIQWEYWRLSGALDKSTHVQVSQMED